MSHHETATPSHRIRLSDPVTTPAPRWTGVKFTCSECTGEFQLEAADVCLPTTCTTPGFAAYKTPACRTPGCGHKTIIVIPRPLRTDDQEQDHEHEQEGNPS